VYDLQTPKMGPRMPEPGCWAKEENTNVFGPENREEGHATFAG
jgi:hypothetical protein